MLRRASRLATLSKLPATRGVALPRVLSATSSQVQRQQQVFARGYAKDKYVFPDDRNKSLGHSQVFKVSQASEEDHRQLDFY